MTVVYIDSVFVLNTVTDYLLLSVTARLAGVPLRRGRYGAAALVGGLYAASAFLPGWGFLTAAPVKIAAGVGLALIAFGAEERLGWLTAVFFAVSCALAGCVLALDMAAGQGVSPFLLLAAGCGAWLLLTASLRSPVRCHAAGTLEAVRVCMDGRVAEFSALRDSGNCLREGGQAVLVVAPGCLDSVLPRTIRHLLTPENLRSPPDLMEPLMRAAPSLRPRLLPYHAVGVRGGLLLSVESGWTEAGGVRYPGLRLALSPTPLGEGYSALWGG